MRYAAVLASSGQKAAVYGIIGILVLAGVGLVVGLLVTGAQMAHEQAGSTGRFVKRSPGQAIGVFLGVAVVLGLVLAAFGVNPPVAVGIAVVAGGLAVFFIAG